MGKPIFSTPLSDVDIKMFTDSDEPQNRIIPADVERIKKEKPHVFTNLLCTAALIHTKYLDLKKGTVGQEDYYVIKNFTKVSERLDFKLKQDPLTSGYKIPGYWFLDKPSIVKGGAVLIGQNELLTASHVVIPNTEDIQRQTYLHMWDHFYNYGDLRVVFDFFFEANEASRKIPVSNVFKIDHIAAYNHFGNMFDYAKIVIDNRGITRAFKAHYEDDPGIGKDIYMLGFPLGMPMCITDSGRVKSVERRIRKHFFTNLEALNGNSGSPIFRDKISGSDPLCGVLIKGMSDFYLDTSTNKLVLRDKKDLKTERAQLINTIK